MTDSKYPTTRRGFLGAGLTGSAALALLGCRGGRSQRMDDANLPPARPRVASADGGVPSSDAADVCVVTEDNIEGPYFKSGAPNRTSLVDAATEGTRLYITGRVLDVACRAIPSVDMQVWQADHNGDYDNRGHRFRGHMATDGDGRFAIETIIPGRYLNGRQYRPAHIHVKLAAEGYRSLTTQLYFDGDPYNGVDPWIRSSLIMTLRDGDRGAKAASFDFVLETA